jgi:hypothetical protein
MAVVVELLADTAAALAVLAAVRIAVTIQIVTL